MKRVKRLTFIFISIALILTATLILLISPLVKYLAERDSEKYTGRKITIDWAYVNPFTGFVYFNNFRIYEARRDTLFFSAKSVAADFALLKLFSNSVEITELVIDHPKGIAINEKKCFNFNDLILRFSPDKLSSTKTKNTTHVNILWVKILHGEFYYREKAIPVNYLVRDLNMESSGKRWDADTIASTFSFLSQNGKGKITGAFTINTKDQDYRLSTSAKDFDLEIIRQYLWELINYGMFSAQVSASIQATGNFKNPRQINARGRIVFNNFHLGKTKKNDYAAFEKLVIVIDQLNPINQKFHFDSIVLLSPFLKYEKYDSLDNVERLFGKDGANISDIATQGSRFNLVIEIGRYLKELSRNFFQSNYKINSLIVTRGNLRFNDFSLNEQFNIGVDSLSIRADSINKSNKRVGVRIKSRIKPFGDLSITLSINPKDSGDFDMYYHINKVPASVFNPYLISYTSFPMDRGTVHLNGVWNVRNGEIKSVNHLVVVDPRISKKVKNKDVKWIPLPLVMAFVRERGNVIDYEIPISGNLKNPHFHLRDVVMDLLKNIFVKPVTIPYGITLRTTENEIENSLNLKWNVRQRILSLTQRNFVKKMAEFLGENKTSTITVYPTEYSQKEKEQILFFTAKKKYFRSLQSEDRVFTKADSVKVDKMSVKDVSFMRALKTGSGAADTLMFSIQDKCNYYISKGVVDSEYLSLVKERNKVFREFFIRNGTQDRLKFHPDTNTVPYNGFSGYKFVYQGSIPSALLRAYEAMHEFDNDGLRKRYAGDFKADIR